jgi:Ran GTPase-activating protein (RanGAP) involved in mRNA processing and transport
MQKIQDILQCIAEGAIDLDLSNSGLRETGVKDIAMALKDNHTLTRLNLRWNHIRDAGAIDIAMALKDNHTMTKLDLSHNEISDAGAKDIATALKDNHTLTTLNLGINKITNAGAQDIAIALKDNHTLMELNLSHNNISDAGATDLALALKDNHTLTVLDLGRNKISDAGATDIAMVLKDNRTLTKLSLARNQISDAGAKDIARVLKDNHSLRVLDLTNNEISDAGAKDIAIALKDNHTLMELNLSHNKITDVGAKDIASALKDNNTLTELRLSNPISAAGAQDFARALKDNHTLTTLKLGNNHALVDLYPLNEQISKVGSVVIKRFLSRNKTYREKHTAAFKCCDIASALLNSPEINEASLSDLNEALDMADAISEDLENTCYNKAPILSREVNVLRALAHLRTGNIGAGLDLYINKLQPQPAEAVSLAIADLILDEQPLPDASTNRALILMCLRGTTLYSAIQFNALQKLRGIDKFTSSQPLATLLGVDKIVSVLDVSKPDEKMQENETCIFYEDLVLSPLNPSVHKVFKGEIPPCVELSHQFELQKKALLDSLKLAYPENPRENHPASSRPSRC